MTTETALRPPSPLLLALEMRAFAEFGGYLAARPLLELAPSGDGHPVLVMPGLAAGDGSTVPLRAFLRRRGYRTYGWKAGRNTGHPGLLGLLQDRLHEIGERNGRAVSLIGWSAGGLYAREIAKLVPERVRQVITLGSPFAGGADVSNVKRLHEWLSGRRGDDPALRERLRATPPQPVTCIYTKTDGIVPWQRCVETPREAVENIEVPGSHSGLGHNPAVLYAIADRLARPEGDATPFARQGWRRLVYPAPVRQEV
ncbi:AcvB/VirJ family lysyl-phosphatidylglycerol hydrolase [Zavarzinia aquatilis]|uniref:Alpha/beta hydrolase n=1 Tax=Zavarzinia aquatilis TaxID=2211142 RepID=A0A317E6Z0_9PROT|nr:AcvB/VirJ family lysyl-phosphatidylglycerol hydrolase [Zavarzinia aquatilis]PWR21173.1 alpha/beta hydrolase [Zavarzinia aquatilis]